MKKLYIAFGLLLFLVSCGGGRQSSSDILEEGDSILIDESTLLSSDTVETKKDTVPKEPPRIRFSSAEDLKEYLRKSPHSGAYSEGIIPLIVDYSLEYAENLINNTHDGFIIVDKSRMKVVLLDKYGREKLSYGMACAKNYGTKHKKADSRTPEGFFSASGIYDSTEWLFTDDDGKTSPKKGQFGPRFIRLKCPNTSQIGIHGTVAPWSIGHRTSHGCIRVTNENILELVKHVTIGMPIIVVPGKKDMEVNAQEGYEIAWIPSTIGAKEPKVKKPEDTEMNEAHEDSLKKDKKDNPEIRNPEEPKIEPEKDINTSEEEEMQNSTTIHEDPLSEPQPEEIIG